MKLGGDLFHKVSSIHNGKSLRLSCTIRWCLYKKESPDLKLRPQESLFSCVVIRPLHFPVPMGEVPATLLLITRLLQSSCANRQCLCHYRSTGRNIRSYARYWRHRIIPTEINIFPFGSTKMSNLPAPRLALRPIQKTLCPTQMIPFIIPVWFW